MSGTTTSPLEELAAEIAAGPHSKQYHAREDSEGMRYVYDQCSGDHLPVDEYRERMKLVAAKQAEEKRHSTHADIRDKPLTPEDEKHAAYLRGLLSETDASRRFRLGRVGAMEIKAPTYLVKGILPSNQLGLIFGKFSTYKSFVAYDLGACVSTSTPWNGHPVKIQGPVIIIAGEGLAGILFRLRAWEKEHGISLADAPLFVSTTAARLCDPEYMAEVAAAVAEIAKTAGAPVLIIVDTWSRNIAGDENSSLDSSQGVAALDTLRAAYGATVAVVHHEGWAEGRTRGSTVLMSAADFAYRTERDANGVMTLTSEKLKDGSPPEPMTFKLKEVDLGIVDEDGEPITSAVLETIEAPASASCPKARGKNQRLLLEILKTAIDHNAQNLKDKGLDPTGAKVNWDQWRSAARDGGLDRRRFNEASQALLAAGLVLSDTVFAWPAEPVSPPNPPGIYTRLDNSAAPTANTAPAENAEQHNSAQFGQSTLGLEPLESAESVRIAQFGGEPRSDQEAIAEVSEADSSPSMPLAAPEPESVEVKSEDLDASLQAEDEAILLAIKDMLEPDKITDPARLAYALKIVAQGLPLTKDQRTIGRLITGAKR